MDISQSLLPDFPLIEQYFGSYIRQLWIHPPKQGRFAQLFASGNPEGLEHRLQRTRKAECFQSILNEVGRADRIRDEESASRLDARLMNAWAEIRAVDQLMRERFIDIRKVKTGPDLVARHVSQLYAVQVTRINREPKFGDLPTGDLGKIYHDSEESIGTFLYRSLEEKVSSFKESFSTGYVRRIVLVTSTAHLQDPFNRHIACRQIAESILVLPRQRFDEVHWLLDDGNGAIFWAEANADICRVRCLVDWGDDPSDIRRGHYENCYWREVDLASLIPAYIDRQS